MSEAPQLVPAITAAPAYRSDRRPLARRMTYDFADFGFAIRGDLSARFEIVPISISEEEAFLFLFPCEDIASNHYSLFNLHAFLKFSGDLEDFAHSRGPSVSTIPLTPTTALGPGALTYDRQILMRDLFKGAEPVIDFIGGHPDQLVRDSHIYLRHRHNHYYSGMIHPPGDEARYDTLRGVLFDAITFI
jgi:hypothetical protein